MERDRSSSETARRYQHALSVLGPFETSPLDRERALTVSERSRLCQAEAIARDRESYGYVRDATADYVRTQIRTYSSESVGLPFANTINLTFNGHELVDQKGDSQRASLRHVAIGAHAMAAADPDYSFYAKRTVYDFQFVTQLESMMRDRDTPIGTVMGSVSPCEIEAQRHAISIGMFPNREMAVVQYARKASDSTLELVAVSLDRANPGLIREFLANHRIELPDGTPAEDVLGYSFTAQADSPHAFRQLIQGDVDRFDASLEKTSGKETKQGQFAEDLTDPSTIPWHELGDLVDNQMAFEEALSWAAMKEPRQLHPLIRQHAEAALKTVRPDGRPLLNETEQMRIRRLLEAGTVHVSNLDNAEAFLILKSIQDTAVDEIIRRHMAGDHQIVRVIQSSAASADPSVQIYVVAGGGSIGISGAQTHLLMQAAAEAAQAGRYAAACGSRASFGEGSPGSIFDPGQFSGIVGKIIRGEDTSYLVADNAPLVMKYGKEKVHYGNCDCCGDFDELGPCAVCNTCDTLDRMDPGYIDKAKARRRATELARAAL
ncbi:MAG TPA: hypothetical protein VGS28_00655 [Candidatus Saccharimonadales bacterium]|nr:hypothetical protein [Candidatus Saccharimonadales bacterium]